VEFAQREGAADPERARTLLEQALRSAPAPYAALEALTRLDLSAGQPERALARIGSVIGEQRAGARVLLLRAEVLARLGRLAPAEADALHVLEAAPALPGAADLAFSVLAAERRLDPAQRAFEEAEAAGALQGGARTLLARLYVARGEVRRAQEIYERVVAENPESADDARAQLAALRTPPN
jgi:Tfp pilus assembly protein PilF